MKSDQRHYTLRVSAKVIEALERLSKEQNRPPRTIARETLESIFAPATK